MASYTINGRDYTNKEAIIADVQPLLNRPSGSEIVGDDFAFLLDLFARHPSAERKIGVGIARIWVRVVAYNTKGFVLERIDGTQEDISYRQCIRPLTQASKAKHAMRRAISDQVLDAKWLILPSHTSTAICPVSGEVMSYHTAHVDHTPPRTFAWLAEQFLGHHGIAYEDIPLIPDSGGIGWLMRSDWRDAWTQFHFVNANLRVISAAANLALAAEQSRKR